VTPRPSEERMPEVGDFVWHIHHEVLLEPLREPIENRIAHIEANKPTDEVRTRLRLMKPVREKLPLKVVEAWKAYNEARKSYNEARKSYNEARKAYNEAWKAYVEAKKAYNEARKAHNEAWEAYVEAGKAYVEAGKAYVEAGKAYVEAGKAPEVLALHAKECPNCPWNGETIFP
jgi:tetratricopeptide (TPR) repeat protein